jgi:hypothetical protein
MKKRISIVTAAIAVLSMGLHPAGASLLGMPLNLKIVIELRDALRRLPPANSIPMTSSPVRWLVKDC